VAKQVRTETALGRAVHLHGGRLPQARAEPLRRPLRAPT
jgi:hypothetical protein